MAKEALQQFSFEHVLFRIVVAFGVLKRVWN